MADGFLSRGIGLLLTPSLPRGSGLLLTRTNTITMLFMRYAIDVAFIDRGGPPPARPIDVRVRSLAELAKTVTT